MNRPLIWGLVASAVSAASAAAPRYTFQTEAPKDAEILATVQRIEQRQKLPVPPVMQQTNKVEVQVPPDESAARRMFIEQLAASYRDGK